MSFWERTQLLIGEKGIEKLRNAAVTVYGLGGVGGYAFEALVRAGVGKVVVVDSDCFEASNLNRQVLALQNTLGKRKVDIAAERAHLINPEVIIKTYASHISPETVSELVFDDVPYAIDAIDSIRAKVSLIVKLFEKQKTFISCMGAAQRLDPMAIQIGDISKTYNCPLAKKVRLALKKQGIMRGIRVVFSTEPPILLGINTLSNTTRIQPHKKIQGSLSYVPGIMGLIAAGAIIQDILNNDQFRVSPNPDEPLKAQ